MKGNILAVKNLSIRLREEPSRYILKDISFALGASSVLGIVGGSGSGKTTLGMSFLNLLPSAMEVEGGEILFEGRDILKLQPHEMRSLRGSRMAMIFQESMSAFDPVYTIGEQIMETILAHEDVSLVKAVLRAKELLSLVEVPDPERVAQSYPHQLSGGLAQRAMIAQALSCNPLLLIADEPTSNLDVTTQAKILETFARLKADLKLSIVLITHDLGVLKHLADEVVILDQGRLVEKGAVANIMTQPKEAYTQELLAAEDL
ncbi:MAG: ABC transporter ATP-binding protein [Candidatus Omnitrophica bacterium]|nr:ABC transporter ATP-binding protein [Candidatus Omnitrophota bacterium]